MYIYNISQYEPYAEDLFLMHEKEFSQEEFERMCSEVKVKYELTHIIVICNHLKDKYGFKNIGDYITGYYEYNVIKC